MEIYVSVIIPVYNSARYLPTCIDSVLSQSLHQIEIICIDDGSTDNSLSILRKYESKNHNILVLHQNNQGAGVARNLGMNYSHGKYISFLDSDDYYPNSDSLRNLYETAEKENALICGGNIITHEGKSPCTYLFEGKKWWNYEDFQELYYFTKYIYNAKMLKDNSIVFPANRVFEDPPFFVKAMICAGKFYAIEDIVYIYRTVYKEMDYSLEKVKDLLMGIKEVCKDAKVNGLNKLYKTMMKYMTEGFKEPIYKYAFSGDESIWNIINEINAMNPFAEKMLQINKKCVNQFISDCKQEKEFFLRKCRLYEKIIVYGAGKVASSILKCIDQNYIEILGVTVTKKNDIVTIGKYEVKEIEEYLPYRRDALIIVAVGTKFQQEILTNLSRLGYIHVLTVDYRKIRFLEML